MGRPAENASRLPSTIGRKIESYQDLLVWQKSMDLVVECHRLAKRLPPNEEYALSSQIRRSAVSIPSNIAEGFGRWHSKEFVHFLLTANGSLKELETHLLIAKRLGFLLDNELDEAMNLTEQLGRMLSRLRQRLSH